MVYLRCHKVLGCDLGIGELELPCVSRSSDLPLRKRIEGIDEFLFRLIDGHVDAVKIPSSGTLRGNLRRLGDTESLADALITRKKEGLLLEDRPSDGATE